MLHVAFVDNVQAAKDFKGGDVVRKTDFRGFFPSPYAGRVDYVDYRNGTVQVQWPWGNEQEQPTELIRDASNDFKPPVLLDQGYSTWVRSRFLDDAAVQKEDTKWRKALASKVALNYEEETKPLWRAACKAHHNGIDEIAAFKRLSSVFEEQFSVDAIKLTVANVYETGRGIPLHLALYWKDRGRQYKVTQREKNVGRFKCPACGGWDVKPRTYRQNKKVLNCRDCGFSISPKDLLWGDSMPAPEVAPAPAPAPTPIAASDKRQILDNLTKIAARLSDQKLSAQLKQAALNLSARIAGEEETASEEQVAIVNPGVVSWQQHIEEILSTLKSLDQELGGALADLETTEQFVKFFKGGLVEESQLKKALERHKKLGKVASSHVAAEDETAGFGDFWKSVKNKFTDEEYDDGDGSGSYDLPDKAVDEFVEGSRPWLDASQYVETEYKENQEFFGELSKILVEMDRLRNDPTRGAVTALRDRVMKLIKTGKDVLNNARRHFNQPKSTAPKTDDTDLGFTVSHFIEMLKEHINDPVKTKQYLRELFSDVGPMLKEASGNAETHRRARQIARTKIASTLIRFAAKNPSSRAYLLPILREITGR
jgi:predicted RNA-binding Zn-ribbon protein involved in translation (DUF1610 family)